MTNLVDFALFQLFWFAAVLGAARGSMWLGPLAVALFLAVHLALIGSTLERLRELRFALAAGVAGALVDSLLLRFDVTAYPTSVEAWPLPFVPPWIASLWLGFALLPRFSLAWLAGRPVLAAVFGALGGPLSYLGGVRLGAVGVGASAGLTYGVLALEYALVTPLLLWLAPGTRGPSRSAAPTFATERVEP